EEPGQGPAIRAQSPAGLPLEFFASMQRVERMLQRFDAYRGAQVMRFDHFNVQVPNVTAEYRFFAEGLGFGCSEYTATDGEPEQLWAAWLHRKQNVHDIALMNGIGPRVHHLGFWLADTLSVLRACDILAGAGMEASIERGPGRHGISNAFFLYLRDPDGNRIEFYANDYLIADPDWEPIRWSLDDPRRQTFWGHAAPASWFDEASHCLSITSDELIPISEPQLTDRPQHVTGGPARKDRRPYRDPASLDQPGWPLPPVRRRDRRRGLRRHVHAPPAARAGVERPGLRGWERCRRHLVLESLPRRALRH